MRLGQQNKQRMRGRNRNGGNKGPNPLTRSYESNGPDVKVRGTAQHIAEKYAQLARDAQASGDPVAAENYLQHAEHYYRIIIAAQAQFAPHQQTMIRNDDQYDDEGEEGAEESPEAPAPQAGFAGRPQGERTGRPAFDRFSPRTVITERPEMGDQPSVEFPVRNEGGNPAPGNGERFQRPPRHERGPRREERVATGEAEAEASPSGAPEAEATGEPGLPSFLTRRRRGRPPFRRRDDETAPSAEGADQPVE